MQTKAEMIANAKADHDELSNLYYAGKSGLSKEEFDRFHGFIWNGLAEDLIVAGHRNPVATVRDLGAELDNLKKRVEKLEPMI